MTNLYLRGISILALCLVVYGAAAQSENPAGAGFGIEMNAMAGKVFKHTEKFTLPIPTLSTANEVNFIWKTCGRKSWQQRAHFPVWGIGITYTDYGIDKVYGRSIGIYPNLQIPLIRGENFEWTMRAGFGVGNINKHYSRGPDWDTLNDAIGSNLNNFSLFMTDLRYRMNKHVELQIGLNFSHISNGTYRQPNLGVNLYGCHIGIRYFPVNAYPVCTIKDLKPLPKRWLLEGRFSTGLTQSSSPDGPEYHVYLATLYVSRRFKSKNKWYAGIDYSYHQDIYAFLKNNEIYAGREAQYSWKGAVLGGVEWGVGCVGIITQMGIYVHEAYLKQDPYYEKLGMHIYLVRNEKGPLKELFLSALLKTHKAVAEVAEFGIGAGF